MAPSVGIDPILLVQGPRHLGAFDKIGRPVAVAQHQQLDPHLLGQRPGRRGVGLRQVVDRVAVGQLQVGDAARVQTDGARGADEAARAAQLVAVLRQDQIGARPVGAQQRGRGLRGLQPGAADRQEAVQAGQFRGQAGVQAAADRAAQRLGARQARVGRGQLRRRGRQDGQRLGQQVDPFAAAQHGRAAAPAHPMPAAPRRSAPPPCPAARGPRPGSARSAAPSRVAAPATGTGAQPTGPRSGAFRARPRRRAARAARRPTDQTRAPGAGPGRPAPTGPARPPRPPHHPSQAAARSSPRSRIRATVFLCMISLLLSTCLPARSSGSTTPPAPP